MFRSFAVQLPHVDGLIGIAEQILAEIIGAPPVDVIRIDGYKRGAGREPTGNRNGLLARISASARRAVLAGCTLLS